MLFSREKKKNLNVNRLLITVNVLGSPGPIRFVVNEEALVTAVIDTALKTYARVGRLPVLGSDFSEFMLHPHDGADGNFPSNPLSMHYSRSIQIIQLQPKKFTAFLVTKSLYQPKDTRIIIFLLFLCCGLETFVAF